MEHKIYDIFPTPIMKFKFDREFNQTEIDFISKSEMNCHKNFGNKSSNDTYILKNNEIKNISEFCSDSLNTYFSKIFNPINDVEIYITQSWLNWTYKNEYHHTHSHPNSIVSGVLYISADKNFDNITFGRSNYKTIEIYPKSLNDYNTDEVDFKVGTGELLLFPSHLQHRVSTTKSESTRISLAFNSFVKGEMGHIRALNYLQL
jgi:uncharacterized protein (TIGR02466 family)